MQAKLIEKTIEPNNIFDQRGFAFGIFLAWFWLAFGQGLCNPLSEKSYLIVVVAAVLLCAGVSLFCISRYYARVLVLFESTRIAIVVCVIAVLASLVLASAPFFSMPIPVILFAAICTGPSAAYILLSCSPILVRYSTDKLFLYIFGSVVVAFCAYYSIVTMPPLIGAILFALLPAASLLCIHFGAPDLTLEDEAWTIDMPAMNEEFRVPERLRMIIGFGICFSATSAVRGASLSGEIGSSGFQSGIEYAMIIGLLLFLAMALATLKDSGRVITFVRLLYLMFVLIEVFCAIPGSLGFEDALPVHIVVELNRLFALPLAMYCVATDAKIRHANPITLFGFIWGIWACFAAGGWILQNVISLGQSVDVDIYLVVNAVVRLASFLFVFSDAQLVRLLGMKTDVSVGSSSEGDTSNSNEKGTGYTIYALTFKEAIAQLANQYGLTDREAEIAFHLAKGRSNNYIADELVLSFHTVRAHVRNIYTKLDVHNRQELLDLIEHARYAAVHAESAHTVQ